MKLYFSASSPFVRKVRVVATELGLIDRIENLPSAAHPVNRDRNLITANPLGQVPAFVIDGGETIYDSRVICEYLNSLAGGSLFPAGAQRWRSLTEQALGDGLMTAGVLTRYEGGVRPEALRWADWSAGQTDKMVTALDAIEAKAAGFGDRVDIGTITLGCAIGYVDFRFDSLGWRKTRPAAAAWYEHFSARPSMKSTVPS